MEMFSDLQRLVVTIAIASPRLLMVLWMLPFLTESVLQGTFRNVFGFSLVVFTYPGIYLQLPAGGLEVLPMLAIVFKEVFIGAIIGFVAASAFWVAASVGFLIDLQRGAFVATLFTAVFRGQVSPLGSLLLQTLTVLFFISGGFLILLNAVYSSYDFWPILDFFPNINSKLLIYIIEQFQLIAYLSIFLAMPILILMFLIDLIMGFINRFVPQLQVFFLSLPIKGALAIFILILYMNAFGNYFEEYFRQTDLVVQKLSKVLE